MCNGFCREEVVAMSAATLPDLLRYRDLAPHGLTRHRFDQLIHDKEYERIAPGVFLRAGTVDDTTAGWIAAAIKRPEATLCLLSALSIHDLTDDILTQSEIAIPRGTQAPTIRIARIAWHRFDAETFEMGRTEYPLPGGVSIGLYSAERTIIDLFRLSHQWGSDLAVDALKRWLRGRGHSPSALITMAKQFPKAVPALRTALEILL
jgi:hypothetical protein